MQQVLNKQELWLAAAARTLAMLVVGAQLECWLGQALRSWAGMVAVIKVMVTMIWEVNLCLGDKSGPFRLVLSGSSERNFFPTTGKKGSICDSPDVGCDQMSGAVRLCGPWFSSVCGEFFPRKGGSCESRHLQEEWSAWGWPRLPLSWFPGKEQVTTQPQDWHLFIEVGLGRCSQVSVQGETSAL